MTFTPPERPTTHELKTWPLYFQTVATGAKPFELRRDDRNFRAGDGLLLREWSPATQAYLGRSVHARITYVLRNCEGLEPGFVVLGLADVVVEL